MAGPKQLTLSHITDTAQSELRRPEKTEQRAKADTPAQQTFAAEIQWFHLFKAMIQNGDVARMGPHAFTVYAVIKAHTNFNTGRAFPGLELITEKSGMSLAQVKRELKTLEACGYLTKEKKGRSNVYTLREKVDIADEHGRPTAVATWDYLPSGVKHAMADLKNVLMSGDLGSAKIVHIEHLTVNVATDNAVQVNLNSASIPHEVREQIQKILRDAGRG